jgi:hypothetical protein
MEPYEVRFPKKRAGVGALIGLAFGAFVAVPWGSFVAPEGPGLWLAAPLVLAFTLLGAWFATVVSLGALDEAGIEHPARPEDKHPVLGGHQGHPTPA